MAYEWTNGELITAEKLNETGGGALIVNVLYDPELFGTYTLDKTWNEIYNARLSGLQCFMVCDLDSVPGFYDNGVHCGCELTTSYHENDEECIYYVDPTSYHLIGALSTFSTFDPEARPTCYFGD